MVPTVSNGSGSMLSAIIATHESERALVPTLAALVPGAAAGLLAEVVVADAGSRDATAEVADIAGCRFISSAEPIGARLKAAAASTRSPWLMFLRAGAVPQAGWIEAANRFMVAYLRGQRDFYRAFRRARDKDPTGYATLVATLGSPDMDKFRAQWERFVAALKFP